MRIKKSSRVLVTAISILLLMSTLTGCSNQSAFPFGSDGKITGEEDSSKSISDIEGKIKKKLELIESVIDERFLDEYETSDMEEGIYKGIMDSLGDPYAGYYTKEEFELIKESAEGSYSGIGAYVSQDVKTGIITIVKPFVDGPASEAGILPGDILFKLDGEEVTGEDLTEVVSRMKGREGTQVTVEVIRENEKEPIELRVKRKTVEEPTITYEMLSDHIGYIYISEFNLVAISQFENAIDSMENDGMDGLIIDLRDNGGGVLDAATSMLDRLISGGLCLYTEDKNGVREEYKLTDDMNLDKPIVVLMNGNSASASEAFAGAIQDYEAGLIVGTTSFGKGIVQSLIPLSDGSAVKMTTSKYYTPKGRSIHEVGVQPDIEEPLDDSLKQKLIIEHDEDNQLQRAIELMRDELK